MKNNLLSEKLTYTGVSQTPTHLHLCVYNAEELQESSAEDFSSISKKIKKDCVNWLQIHGLKNTESVREVCEYFKIDFLVVQDILNPNHPTKIEEHEQYTVLILKLFHYNDNQEMEQQQVSLIQGENFVLSFLEVESSFFDNISQALQENAFKIRGRQADYILSVLLNNVMGNYVATISTIEEDLEDMEADLLTINDDKDIGAHIQARRRQYMTMKKAIFPLKDQYSKLLRAEDNLMHKVNRPFFNDVNDHLQFILQTIEICRETLSSLVDLYISNNDLRMNSIMKRLTAVSTIFIPLTFLVGVWGMNFKFMPELDWRYGYFTAWVLMVVIGIIVYLYLRKRKWD